MSDMGSNKVESLLPEDIEAILNKINSEIADLERKKFDIIKEIEEKFAELALVKVNLVNSNEEYNKVISKIALAEEGFKERETKIIQKESALNVYANALTEKERKINKYLAIFDGMKDTLR